MRKDAKENRKAIMYVASELFSQHGTQNVSMNQIAKTLGIGMGTLYRHFPDKGALCFELIKQDAGELKQQLTHINQTAQTPVQNFEQSLHLFINFKYEHSEMLRCIENSANKINFKDSDMYRMLYQHFSVLIGEENPYTRFKTDMLLNALTTESFEYQINTRKVSQETLEQYLIQLFT